MGCRGAYLGAGGKGMKRLIVPENGIPYTVEVPDEEAPPPWQPKPPAQVTMRQARLALLAAGLLDDVEAMLAQADRAVQIEWEYATVVDRSSALVQAIGAALGLSEQRIDELFADAATR